MKFLIFGAFCALSIPLMVWAAASSARLRGLLLSALVFTTCLGPRASIHLVTFEDYRGTEDGYILFLSDIICVGLIGGLLTRFRGRIRWLPRESAALGALFALALVSTVQAANPQFATFTLFTCMKAYAVYWCVVNCLATGTSPVYLWYGLVGIGGLLSAVTLKQHFISHAERVSALFPHPNTLPTYTFLFLPLLLLWGLCGPGLGRIGRALSVAVSLGLSLGIVLTLSRAGIVLLGVMLFVSLLLAMKRTTSAQVRRACVILLALMMVGGAVLSAKIVHRFATAPAASGEARVEFNEAALRMAADCPLGVGPNNYSHVLSTNEDYRRRLDVLRYETVSGVCHNIYLLTAAELGWGGLALLLLVVLRFCALAARAARRSRRFEGVALWCLLLGWLCVLANGSLEWVLRQAAVMDMYAIVAAFAICLAESVERQALASRRAPATAAARAPQRTASLCTPA